LSTDLQLPPFFLISADASVTANVTNNAAPKTAMQIARMDTSPDRPIMVAGRQASFVATNY